MYRSIIALIIALFVIGVPSPSSTFPALRPLHAQAAETQTDHLRNFEAQIIYLTNLKRRDNGLPPVRWNRQLTEAARWLSSDAVENSDGRYCGHIDSLGRSPGERIKDFGYPRADTWAEHVVCGYVAPAAALEGWYRNETYRRQLLSPDVREVGVGYYVNPETGYGYVTQLLSADPDFSPLVINHEALNSTSRDVTLYVYDAIASAEFEGIGSSEAMMIANEPTFSNGAWQSFQSEVQWRLSTGSGWKDVYVKTIDSLGRTKIVYDSIFLGEEEEMAGPGLDQASSGGEVLTFTNLDDNHWPRVQFRLNWVVSDGSPYLRQIAGRSQRIEDDLAVDGSTYKLSGNSDAHLRLSTPNFYRDMPLIAYFRLKVESNVSDETVLEVWVDGGGVQYGPLMLTASQFEAPDEYQDFALPFEFHDSTGSRYLTFDIKARGGENVYLDGITYYQRGIEAAATTEWSLPKQYDRGSGAWARYADANGQFSAEIALNPIVGAAVLPDVPPPGKPVAPEGIEAHKVEIYIPLSLNSH